MITLLAFSVVVIFLLIIFQITRTSELLSVLKGEGLTTEDSDKTNATILLIFMVLFLIGAVSSAFLYKDTFLPESASEHGVWIDEMFNLTLFFTGIVFIITQALLFYFAYKYRRRKGHTSYYYPHNNKLEVIWTVIPAIVLTILVVMGIENWFKITAPAPKDSVLVEVTGQQFNWIVRYAGMDNELGHREFDLLSAENALGINWDDPKGHDDFYATEIIMPVGQPVLFKLGAKDVMHSFYLPHFRVKMDCVPGIPTQFWLTPTITTADMRAKLGNNDFNYEMACTEFCGAAHWNMRLKVTVVTPEEYKAWTKQQTPIYDAVKAQREQEKLDEQADQGIVSKDSEAVFSANQPQVKRI